MGKFNHKEYAKQMRENCYKDENGNIICSAELWEHIASIIESCTDVVPKSEVEKLIAEAIQDFAKELKESCTDNPYVDYGVVQIYTDDLVKKYTESEDKV